MSHKSFIVALALIGALSWFVAAQEPAMSPQPAVRPAEASSRPGRSAPRPPGPTSRPAPASRPHELPEQRISELLAYVERQDPRTHKSLLELRRDNPEEFQHAMARLDRLVRSAQSLPPELRDMMNRSRSDNVLAAELVKQYQATTAPAEKARLRRELRQVVGRQFDDLQRVKVYRVEQLAKRIEELRRELEQRSRQREQIINERIEDLLEGTADRIW